MKLLLKIFAGLIGLVATSILAIIVLIDPNDFKEDITKLVKEHTGREFAMQSIELSLFPTIGLNLQNTKLSNAQGFSAEPFAKIDEVHIGAALLPLFSQQLVVDTLTLKGLQLTLEKNAEGKTNWDDLTNASKMNLKDTQDAASQETTSNENPLEALKSLQFGGLNITDAKLIWRDASTNQAVTLYDLSVTTGQIQFNEYFPIAIRATTDVQAPKLQNTLKLTLFANLSEQGTVQLKDIQLNNLVTSPELPVTNLKTQLNLANLAIEPNLQSLQIPTLSIQQSATGQNQFVVDSLNADLTLNHLTLDLENQTYSAKSVVLNSQVESKQLGLTPADKIQLSAPFVINLNNQTAQLESLKLSLLDIHTTANIQAQNIMDGAIVDAKLSTQTFNLKALFNKLQITLPEMQNAQALQKISQSMNVHFEQKNQLLKIQQLNVSLDDSTLTGSSRLANFDKPAIQFELALDKINVSNYLPPKAKAEAKANAADTKTPETTEPSASTEEIKIELPNDLLRSLNIAGRLTVGDLQYDNLNPKNILVELNAKDGKIKVAPAAADIFGTRITTIATIDARTDDTNYTFKVDAPKVPVGDVLLAFTEKDTLTGFGSVNADLSTHGITLKQLMSHLNGKADMDLKDGAIKGFNLAQSIRDAKSALSSKSTKEDNKSPKQTDFSALIAKVDIKDGLVKSREITAFSPYMRVNGDGTADLDKETLDFLVKTKIVATEKGQGGADLEDLKGLTIPVKIQKSWYDPKISLDLKSLLDAKAKQELEKKKDELKSKAEEKLKKQLDEKLQNGVEDKLKDAFKGFKF